MSKYKAQKTMVGDEKFDSKAEARRWGELSLLERAGHISSLERQPVYILARSVKFHGAARAKPALRYVADFRYFEDGRLVIEDTKGIQTEAFRIKLHLMKSIHNIDILVTS